MFYKMEDQKGMLGLVKRHSSRRSFIILVVVCLAISFSALQFSAVFVNTRSYIERGADESDGQWDEVRAHLLERMDKKAIVSFSQQFADLQNQLVESWFYISNLKFVNASADIQDNLYGHYTKLFSQAERIRDILEPVREKSASDLVPIIFQRLEHLQNPENCSSVKFAICKLNDQPCGFGCQIHHLVYCLFVAYGTGRSLYVDGTPWRYSPNGYTATFLPVGDTEKCLPVIKQHNSVHWDGLNSHEDAKVIHLSLIGYLKKQPDYLPMAIPQDLAEQLKTFHSQPFLWWLGQFMRYVTRPKESICNTIASEIKSRFNVNVTNFSAVKPLVGLQIRRTDKLIWEAKFYPLSDYMKWVKQYYDQLDYKSGHHVIRSVYIATDEPSVLQEAIKQYPNYTFYSDPGITKSASTHTRFTENSLLGILIDILWLARSDYLVCTFSSNMCRIVYALMQTLHGDASDRARSLDQQYIFSGSLEPLYEAVLPHVAAKNSEEMDMKVGDLIGIDFYYGNRWNGYFRGTNKRTKQAGFYPTHKVRDVLYVAPMPRYSEVKYQNDYKLPFDNCLLV